MKTLDRRVSTAAHGRSSVAGKWKSDKSPEHHRHSARKAGLRYVTESSPGITRHARGHGFLYEDHRGKPIHDAPTLRRIKSLAIPPAWTNVWICPTGRGHIQAVGRDAKGRKQYRYHPNWTQVRDEAKYGRMIAFVRALPHIRSRIKSDMSKAGLPREKVLATVVRLLETTLIRVGNDEYASRNNSFGLTTLRDRHAEINGHTLRFRFKGKSGVFHDIDISDRRVAKIVKKCQELPGQELLQYLDDDGVVRDVASADVNEYLREISGQDFTAKDFRTWAGTLLAAQALQEFEKVDSDAQAKKNVLSAVESVAKKLGNTRAVCRKCYIHPAILDSYMDGELIDNLKDQLKKMIRNLHGLQPEEAAVLMLLERRLKR